MTLFKIDIDFYSKYGNKRSSHISLTVLGVEVGLAYYNGYLQGWYEIEWLWCFGYSSTYGVFTCATATGWTVSLIATKVGGIITSSFTA